MKYSLDLVESDSQIIELILKNLLPMLNKKLDTGITKMIRLINLGLENSIRNQSEYASLTSPNGKLRIEFGITDPGIVDNVITSVIDSVFVQRKNLTISNKRIVGGVMIGFLPNNVILSVAEQFSVITEKGQPLPWLKWLLFEGTAAIIKDYDIKIGPNFRSRTGEAVMVQSTKSWRVPPEFVGTYSDNWFTRAIDAIDDSIEEIMKKSLE